ncbi:MAG TPA: UDP-glucose/GDP-mannose dehydrogenase family protein [Burkholderiaceae bacterium]|nr:UDP-glucose/GDP-mannose dehydrogenase family protein [Burkholderiaceae bacterium]
MQGLSFAADANGALDGADALLIVTEWREFRSPDFEAIAQRLQRPLVIDGRNLFDPAELRQRGIEYLAIGRGNAQARA